LLHHYRDTEVINYQDRNGQTPLHWACEKEYASCVKAVLAYYPKLTLKDKDENVAMAIAEKNKNPEVKKEMQSYGTVFFHFLFLFEERNSLFL
jgi:ankyrin repeat protein